MCTAGSIGKGPVVKYSRGSMVPVALELHRGGRPELRTPRQGVVSCRDVEVLRCNMDMEKFQACVEEH